MSRTVQCIKYKQSMKGLDTPPMPGPTGQQIFETVSKQAWQEWIQHQTVLINEYRLNLMNPGDRAYLIDEMHKFLANEEVEKPADYTPPSS